MTTAKNDAVRQCTGCYLRHSYVETAASSCRYCFTGQVVAPDTLILPPVWTGLNALSVFAAIQKLSLEYLRNDTLTIDFSQVEYLDSSGLGALIGLRKKLAAQGTFIHITGARDHALRLLNTANFHQLFIVS